MIREIREGDLERCAAILSDSRMWDVYGREYDDAVFLMKLEFRKGTQFWVWEDGGEVLGFIGAVRNGMMGEFTYVRMVAVDRAHRGKGIGTKLIAHLEETMFRAAPHIFMMVTDFNTDAKRLYLRLGYREIGTVPNYKKKGVDEYLLMKTREGYPTG